MGKEWELKFAVQDKDTLDRIAAYTKETLQEMNMSAVYYDTEDLDLQQRKWTLRLRQEGETSVVTMKSAGDGFTRGEWEYPAETLADCACRLTDLGAPEELLQLLQKPIFPRCGAQFTRRFALLSLGDATAELALDFGILFRGETQLPLCEMELELKEGNAESVLVYGEALAKQFSLTKEPRSKFLRASSL